MTQRLTLGLCAGLLASASSLYGTCEGAGQQYMDEAHREERMVGTGFRGYQNYRPSIWQSLNMAAQLGNPQAEFEIGELYAKGWIVQQDWNQAARHYERAAACRIADAEYEIGAMTEVGYVYPKSWKQAAEWYERAGAHGSYRGYSSLGLIAFNGHLGERNINEAIRYFNLAAKLGSHEDSLRARALTANPNIRNTDQLADAGARIEVADNPPATNTNTRQANGLRYVCGFPKSVSTNGCVWR